MNKKIEVYWAKGTVVKGKSKNNELLVWNAWDHGDGVMQAWLRGAAMKKEVISENHFRYYCNDGHPDDNFDDIVFEVKISQV